MELQHISHEISLAESTSNDTISLFSVPAPVEDKRLKTRVLTFIRQNYLKIIKIQLFVLLVVIAMFLSYVLYMNHSTLIAQTSTTELYIPSSTENFTTPTSDSDEFYPTLPCRKIDCGNITDCNPAEINLISMKIYSCCSCLPEGYDLIRVEQSLVVDKIDLYLKVPFNLSRLSSADLAQIEGLNHIRGIWDVSLESQATRYLVYRDVEVQPSILQD